MTPATVAAGSRPTGIATRPDTVGPTTTIESGPSGTVHVDSATFTFSSDEPGSVFQCSFDGGPFASCSSPEQLGGLAAGPHRFAVRATDFSGNTGGAARASWTVELAAPAPSNEFRFGKLSKNRRRGTAKLAVLVPGAGLLKLRGKGARTATRPAAAAGTLSLPVVVKGKATKQLAAKGSTRIRVEVTFTPTGGASLSHSRSVTLTKTG